MNDLALLLYRKEHQGHKESIFLVFNVSIVSIVSFMVIYPSFLGFNFGDAILNKQPLRFVPVLNPYKTQRYYEPRFLGRGNLEFGDAVFNN
jgi:hypothetical protein